MCWSRANFKGEKAIPGRARLYNMAVPGDVARVRIDFLQNPRSIRVSVLQLAMAVLIAVLIAVLPGTAWAGARPPAEGEQQAQLGGGSKGADMRPMRERWGGAADLSRTSDYDGMVFRSGGDYETKEAPGSKKEFGSRAFNHRGEFVTKDFYTREWTRSKQGWGQGDKEFATGEANTDPGRTIQKVDEPYGTKDLEQRAAYDAAKQMPTKTAYDASRPFAVKGKAQQALDSQNPPSAPLSVDQVKELLNKSK